LKNATAIFDMDCFIIFSDSFLHLELHGDPGTMGTFGANYLALPPFSSKILTLSPLVLQLP